MHPHDPDRLPDLETVTDLLMLPAGANCWDLHDAGAWVLIPTNRQRRRDGTAVMGAGLARQAADRYPDLPARYGRNLAEGRDRIQVPDHRLLLAPTKDHWRAPATLDLVRALLDAAGSWCRTHPRDVLVLPAPGCGLGGLPFPQVADAATQALAGCRAVLLAPGR